MENIVLVFPTEEMETQALEFKKDFFDSGEKTINGSYRLDMNKYTYLEWLQMLKDNLNDKKVNPRFGFSHTFFALNDKNTVIGIVNFRHTLTDFYRDSGHIGYSVRPSERNKGYATAILSKTLEFAKEQGFKEICLVCKKGNIPSRKTIIKNGGIITRIFSNGNSEYEEYRILLSIFEEKR